MITDDDLLLYHYRDGLDAAERARIGAALVEQPELAQRLHRLVARLDTAAALPEVPVPAPAQQRWLAALERAAHAENRAGAPRAGRFAGRRWLAAAAAVAVLALFVTFQMGKRSAPVPVADDARPAAASVADASAYERGLKWHLESTEQQLAGFVSATPEERAHLVETIIAQNRMYALAADRAGEPRLARALRAFAPILEELASDGGDSSASVAQLSFEMRVMQARLGAAAGTTSNGHSTTL